MARMLLLTMLVAALTGCNAEQSTLEVFGADARAIRHIAIILTSGAVIILAITVALYVRAVRAPEHSLNHEQGMRMILWVGAIGPTLILTALLLYALPAMRPRPADPGDLVIRVEGEQFWWRVAYWPSDNAPPLSSANEIRVPVGRTVVFELMAKDVIHSFWIPGLAGKMDMIPGRTNRLVVKAEKPGRYRGVCAEFCGLSHALMAFDVIAMEPAAFDTWLADARAITPLPAIATPGRALFDVQGCGACHTIRGTPHAGTIGPDLSRFGERMTLGAGILPPAIDNIAAFIRTPQQVKPGVRMPAYPQLSQEDASAIAHYLKGMK